MKNILCFFLIFPEKKKQFSPPAPSLHGWDPTACPVRSIVYVHVKNYNLVLSPNRHKKKSLSKWILNWIKIKKKKLYRCLPKDILHFTGSCQVLRLGPKYQTSMRLKVLSKLKICDRIEYLQLFLYHLFHTRSLKEKH